KEYSLDGTPVKLNNLNGSLDSLLNAWFPKSKADKACVRKYKWKKEISLASAGLSLEREFKTRKRSAKGAFEDKEAGLAPSFESLLRAVRDAPGSATLGQLR
ncbi:hypothetical protein PMAYCL1PPCAC_27051, partial [Pristionchus mayeri]